MLDKINIYIIFLRKNVDVLNELTSLNTTLRTRINIINFLFIGISYDIFLIILSLC